MYWPLASSGTRYRTRTRPPSSGETVASSRSVTKAGPSTPVRATLAITRDHSPVLSSARSILVSDDADAPAFRVQNLFDRAGARRIAVENEEAHLAGLDSGTSTHNTLL